MDSANAGFIVNTNPPIPLFCLQPEKRKRERIQVFTYIKIRKFAMFLLPLFPPWLDILTHALDLASLVLYFGFLIFYAISMICSAHYHHNFRITA